MGLFDDDEENWGQPVESTGDFAKPETLQGHLLIILPIGYVAHSLTRFSQAGKKSDALVCDIIDLDAPGDDGNPGKVYRATWLRQAQLIVGLRPFVGKRVLGVIGKGMPKNGMNPPWIVTDMSSDQNCRARASAWGAAHRSFVVSPFQEPAAPPPAPTAPQFQAPQQNQWQPPQQPPFAPPQQYQPDPWATPTLPQPQFQQPYQQPAPAPYGPAQQGYSQAFPQQPQQVYQQPAQQQAPRFPVPQQPGAPTTDMDMLARMRQMRDQQLQGTGPQPDMPPF